MHSHLLSEQSRAVVTVVTRNHLHFAVVLAQSVRELHPDLRIVLCVADAEIDEKFDIDHVEIVAGASLDVPDWDRFAFQYRPIELTCALKPHAIRYAFEQGAERVFYLDGDICVYGRLDGLFSELDDQDIVLTPHLLGPLPEDGYVPNETMIVRHGVFNAGCVGTKRNDNASRFLAWWCEKLQTGCINDLANNKHLDQIYLNAVPTLFQGVGIVRDPAMNVAYWNLGQRRFEKRGERYLVDGRPLVFFHFSGYDRYDPATVTNRGDRVFVDQKVLGPLAEDYGERLNQVEAEGGFSEIPYRFANFEDGEPIPDDWREAVRMGLIPSKQLRCRRGDARLAERNFTADALRRMDARISQLELVIESQPPEALFKKPKRWYNSSQPWRGLFRSVMARAA